MFWPHSLTKYSPCAVFLVCIIYSPFVISMASLLIFKKKITGILGVSLWVVWVRAQPGSITTMYIVGPTKFQHRDIALYICGHINHKGSCGHDKNLYALIELLIQGPSSSCSPHFILKQIPCNVCCYISPNVSVFDKWNRI